jgi:hypothetical protein
VDGAAKWILSLVKKAWNYGCGKSENPNSPLHQQIESSKINYHAANRLVSGIAILKNCATSSIFYKND